MKKLSKIVFILLSLLSIIMFIKTNDFVYLLFIGILIIPYIIKLNDFFTILYSIFVFLSSFLGVNYGLYQVTTWYDTFNHFLWGILSSLIALYILDELKMFDSKNIIFNLLFILTFSLATACFWEILEYATDKVLLKNTQRVETGVNDTMKDIIISLLGNLLFLVTFWYEYQNNCKLLIKRSKELWSNGKSNNRYIKQK